MIAAEQEGVPRLRSFGPIEKREEELARAGIYRLLAALLGNPPDQETLHALYSLSDGSSPIDNALKNIAIQAKKTDADSVANEYYNLFVGLGEGELVPYGSYYLAGFLHEKPLARLRSDLQHLEIEQQNGIAEPEDSISSVCEVMSALVAGDFGNSTPLEVQRNFFVKHIGSWADDFFKDLEKAKSALFYARVGALGTLFMSIEKQAFAIAD
jgi:TorA maturation chaperone TorD